MLLPVMIELKRLTAMVPVFPDAVARASPGCSAGRRRGIWSIAFALVAWTCACGYPMNKAGTPNPDIWTPDINHRKTKRLLRLSVNTRAQMTGN